MQLFPFLEIPNWAVRLVVLAIVAGFPIALVIAWAFELTPQGLKRTEDVDLAAQGSRKRHGWIYIVIIGALLSIGLFFIGRYAGQHASSGTAAIESEIAKTIAETLRAKLTGSEQTAIAARPTENTEAYQLYLKGRFFWNKRTGQNLNKAADYFNQAIAADPKYALAYVGLADSYLLMPLYGAGAPQDCYPKAEAAARKAIGLDDVS